MKRVLSVVFFGGITIFMGYAVISAMAESVYFPFKNRLDLILNWGVLVLYSLIPIVSGIACGASIRR